MPKPIQNITKYLGVHLDKRLTSAQHTKKQKKTIQHTPAPSPLNIIPFNEFKKQIANLQNNYNSPVVLRYPHFGTSKTL